MMRSDGVWKREFMVTLRQALFVLSFYSLVPLLYLLDVSVYRSGFTFMEYMSNGLDLFILLVSGYLAYNMFRPEEEQGAMEYLLSIPLGRRKLFGLKILPRMAVLVPLMAAGRIMVEILHTHGSVLYSILINWRFGFLYMVLFMLFIQMCGFLLGLVGRRSWSTRLLLAFTAVTVWKNSGIVIAVDRIILKTMGWRTFMTLKHNMSRSMGFRNVYTLEVLINFAVFYGLILYVLVPLMKIWDMKALRFREVWFQKRAILPLLAFLLLFVNRLVVNPLVLLW